jgi:hypothetical protein
MGGVVSCEKSIEHYKSERFFGVNQNAKKQNASQFSLAGVCGEAY